MTAIIEARELSRSFGSLRAVDEVNLQVEAGTVLGLIGPNGAGKTTLLRSLLGLTRYSGHLEVLGLSPKRERAALMEEVCFIADTAVLPRWMQVSELLDYVSGVHPRFSRSEAERFLQDSEVDLSRKIRDLSKGMSVQLHLALVMAIDARLLILDEPTLGLDIIFRKHFFEQLLNDYFDGGRTIIISTHQVEEVQNILTDVVFMDRGKLILQQPMARLDEDFVELHAVGDALAQAQAIAHIGSRSILGGKAIIYQGVSRETLAPLGKLHTPSVADLFMAKMMGDRDHG